MNPTTIGWMFVLNAAVVASASSTLKAFKIYDLTYGKDLPVNPSPRIYGGKTAREGQFKFMILSVIKVGENVSLCSSSLLTSTWVLTAGHCVNRTSLERVILVGGKSDVHEYLSERINTPFDQPLIEKTYGAQERWGERILIHPEYNTDTFEHDFALIRANRPFVLGEMVTTIPLSTRKMTSVKFCTILGWGMVPGNILPYKLNYVEEKEVSTTDLGCEADTRSHFICLKPDFRGICRGDSGSPLVCDGEVWGVASHLSSPSEEYICGGPAREYYAEIYYDLKWILNHINSGHVSCNVNLKSLLLCVITSFWISLKI